MKMVKMDDEVHARLKAMSDGDTTMSQVVEGLLGGVKDDGIDRLLDQITMLHSRFDDLEASISSLSFSPPVPETPLEVQMRQQKEIEDAQRHAIEHPEDNPQW